MTLGRGQPARILRRGPNGILAVFGLNNQLFDHLGLRSGGEKPRQNSHMQPTVMINQMNVTLKRSARNATMLDLNCSTTFGHTGTFFARPPRPYAAAF